MFFEVYEKERFVFLNADINICLYVTWDKEK